MFLFFVSILLNVFFYLSHSYSSPSLFLYLQYFLKNTFKKIRMNMLWYKNWCQLLCQPLILVFTPFANWRIPISSVFEQTKLFISWADDVKSTVESAVESQPCSSQRLSRFRSSCYYYQVMLLLFSEKKSFQSCCQQ